MRRTFCLALFVLLLGGCVSPSGSQDVVVPIAQATVRPRPKYQPAPVYPFELWSKRIQGSAVVDVIIDRRGKVKGAKLVRATHAEFGAAAMAAVQKWEFSPASRDGTPVSVSLRVPMDFEITTQEETDRRMRQWMAKDPALREAIEKINRRD